MNERCYLNVNTKGLLKHDTHTKNLFSRLWNLLCDSLDSSLKLVNGYHGSLETVACKKKKKKTVNSLLVEKLKMSVELCFSLIYKRIS